MTFFAAQTVDNPTATFVFKPAMQYLHLANAQPEPFGGFSIGELLAVELFEDANTEKLVFGEDELCWRNFFSCIQYTGVHYLLRATHAFLIGE